MLAACGSVVVSALRYRRRRGVRGSFDVAPSKRIGIKHPHLSHLFYCMPIGPFTPEEIHPVPNRNGPMSCSGSRYPAIFSLPQARHALVIHLSVMIALLPQG